MLLADLREELDEPKRTVKSVFGELTGSETHVNFAAKGFESLLGMPTRFEGDLDVSANPLYDLKHCPKTVLGNFNTANCDLTTLEYFPSLIGGKATINNNTALSSFNFSSLVVVDRFEALNVGIDSVSGIHKKLASTDFLWRAPYTNPNMMLKGVLSLLLIDGIRDIDLYRSQHKCFDVETILKKYIGHGRAGILDCQQELIAAGFGECAKL